MFDYGFAAARKKTWLHKLPAKIAGPRDALSSPPGVQEDGAREELRMCPPTPEKNQTSNQTSLGCLVFLPAPATFARFPFRFPFRGGKGTSPRGGWRGVCGLWGEGGLRTPRNPPPNPSRSSPRHSQHIKVFYPEGGGIPNPEKDLSHTHSASELLPEKARPKSFEKLLKKIALLGTVLEVPRPGFETQHKTSANAHPTPPNVDILGCFASAVPRPRGKPRGTLPRREIHIFASKTDFFLYHEASPRSAFG